MSRADTWMPLYIADYLRKTMHLTRDQHGAYFLLLMACWDRGGQLPNDPGQLAGISRATPAEWRKLAPILLPFFEVDGDFLTQGRVLEEREKAQRLSEARRESGRQGGRPRKQTESEDESERKPIGFADKNLDETPARVAPPSPSQVSEPSGSSTRSEAKASSFSAGEPPRASRSRRKATGPIPEGYPDAAAITDAEGWITDAGVKLGAKAQAARFRQHALANGRQVADWGEAWRGWIGIAAEDAPPTPVAKPPPAAATWPGPPEIRAAVVAAKGEAFARSFLDTCGWINGPAREITSTNSLRIDRLRQEVGDIIAHHNAKAILIQREGRAA